MQTDFFKKKLDKTCISCKILNEMSQTYRMFCRYHEHLVSQLKHVLDVK